VEVGERVLRVQIAALRLDPIEQRVEIGRRERLERLRPLLDRRDPFRHRHRRPAMRAAQSDTPLYVLARKEECECDQRCQDDDGG